MPESLRTANPVGVFDSGIGGLTVARAISALLPEEQLIYFGDTVHVPYGEKSPELIRTYAARITAFLLNEKSCKAIVIACNTASAAAYETLRNQFKGIIPVINVIDPMIETVIADETITRVGIIATRTTIASGVYQEKFTRRKPSLRFAALATPLLASMIEEGFYNNSISRAVLAKYLSDPVLQDIDGLILACTHYPLIKNEIAEFFQHKIKIFDSAEVVAQKLKTILTAENLLNEKRQGEDVFYVSDLTESFKQTTTLFYGRPIALHRQTV